MIKLKTEEISAMIAEVRATQEACRILNDRIQAMCPHEEWQEGFYAFAVFQQCLLCKACGKPKFGDTPEIRAVPYD